VHVFIVVDDEDTMAAIERAEDLNWSGERSRRRR
jgi:hypothetical protein